MSVTPIQAGDEAAVPRARTTVLIDPLLMLGALGTSMMTGCGEVSLIGKMHTSTFTLTATSGSVTHSQTITLNVDNLGN